MARLGLGLGARAPQGRWWPEGALYAADFTRGLYMRNGLAISAAEAFTFTRASSKLALGRGGVWTSYAPNVPCITERGLLLEPERTNTALNSSWFENWGLVRTAVTPNGRLGIDGTLSADLVAATTSNVNGAFAGASTQTVVPGAPYSFSMILERASSDWIALMVTTADFVHRQTVWFNLATATPGSTSPAGTDITLLAPPQIEALPTGQLRVAMTIATATTTAPIFRMYLCDGNGALAVSAGASVWSAHGQVEAGGFLSSPMLSLSGVQTRPRDQCLLNTLAPAAQLYLKWDDAGPVAVGSGGSFTEILSEVPRWLARSWVT